MPTYTAPTTRTTGELISAAIFNTDLVENIKYFKDAPAFAGNVTVGGTLGVTGLITSTGGITGGASSHTTGAFSSTVTGGTYNGQTISSAANFTGTLTAVGAITGASHVTPPVADVTIGDWTQSRFVIKNNGSVNNLSQIAFGYFAGTYAPASQYLITTSGSGNTKGDFVWALRDVTTDTAPTERMRLSSAGLLTVSGFGTHSFSAGGTGGNTLQVINTTSGTGNFSIINLGNDAGNDQAAIRLNSTTFTTSGINVAAALKIQNAGAGGMDIVASNGSGAIRFYSGGTTERMRIGASGEVGIGVSAPTNYRLYIRGTGTSSATYGVHTEDSGGTTTMFVRDDGLGYLKAASWLYGSDRRLKENIAYFDELLVDAAKVLRQLRPAKFDYIGGVKASLGFIAQDVQRIIPEAVTVAHPDTEMLGLHTEFMTPFLVAGWQQHDARLAAMEAKLLAAGV